MDNNESIIEYYHFNNWRSGKSYINLSYSHLYICRYWNAIVFEGLHTRQVLSGSSASVRINQLIERIIIALCVRVTFAYSLM